MTDEIQVPALVDLSKYIETHFFGERPHVRGRRVPVANIVRRAHLNHWTATEVAYDLDLSEAEVLAALLYYEEHQIEIDTQEAIEQARFDEMKRLHGDS